jgi:hypothetical protein
MPFVSLDRLRAEPPEWLWRDRLALGHLHVLDGDPGRGKSFVCCDLAARLSRGEPWPDGTPNSPASSVLLNAEDDAGTVRSRLVATGAVPERIQVWERQTGESWPRISDRLGALDATVARVDARLVVLDPVVAFMGPHTNLADDASIRRALSPLGELAARRNCAIVLVRHLRKRGARHAAYRGLGSIGLLAACRGATLIGPDPDDTRRQVWATTKTNLGPPPPSLSFSIADDSGRVHVAWHGFSPWSAEDLGSAAAEPETSDARLDHAKLFLVKLLAARSRTKSEVGAAARSEGIAARTLHRAAAALNVIREVFSTGQPGGQPVYWRLPPRSAEAEDAVDALLGELEQQAVEGYLAGRVG